MADTRITGLTELTSVDSGDLLAIVDDPSGTPVTKKITQNNLIGTHKVVGTQDIWIPAGAWWPRTTNGAAALAQSETTTNKINYKSFDFDSSTQEFIQVLWQPPRNWNNSTVKFTPYWTAASGSGGVVWALQGVALSNDDALDTAIGTEQTSTDTLIATGDVHIGPQSLAITIAGSPADGDLIVLQFKRNPSDGSDTLAADAKFLGLMLEVSIDQGTSS